MTIPATDVSAMTLDTGDSRDTIRIISDAAPMSITADSGGGVPTINLGDSSQNETISGSITNASGGTLLIAGSGTTTITGNLVSQGTGGITLAGAGTINISGKINLGTQSNLVDSASGQDAVSGEISGASATGFGPVPGLTGAYYNLPATQDLIEPANASNPSWLGNQTPSVTARLIGPIDFPDIADNGFADSVGDPAYYNIGGGNNNVEARWYGDILIPGSGTAAVPIDFATTSDDGSMLYIDGNAVVYNNNFQGATQATGLVDLTPGLHTIDIEYYQGNGGATMDAQWDPSGGTNFVDIPVSALSSTGPINGVTMAGSGTLTLALKNTYIGSTTINAGTLVAAANGAMGTATAAGVFVNSGGALAFVGGVHYTIAEPLTVNGTGPAGGGAIENLGGVNTFAGPITVAGTALINSFAGSLTLGGNINIPGAGVKLTGAGATIINGNVNLGAVGNLTDIGSGQITINGTISGNAAAGSVMLPGLAGSYFNVGADPGSDRAGEREQSVVAGQPDPERDGTARRAHRLPRYRGQWVCR